jgi:multicomponent Na+:H+ antiporter subunit F
MFLAVAGALVVVIVASFYRVVVGPTLFDRMLAGGLIGTTNIALIAVLGFIYGRPDMFVDLTIAYALLNFVGLVAIARYLESQGRP